MMSKVSTSIQKNVLWLLITFGGLSFLLAFTPASRLLPYLIPATAVACALRINLRAPHLLLEYLCWLYVLTPGLRRIVDSHTGVSESVLMSTPYLVSGACLCFALLRASRIINRQAGGVLLIISSILYGAGITVIGGHLRTLPAGLAAWILPLGPALYLYSHRQELTEHYEHFRRAMTYSTAVLGVYGCIQYWIVPSWDRIWMENVAISSIGTPEPFKIRVFSLLNAPQVLGAFLVVGILFSLNSPHRIKVLSVSCGIIALALSSSRSAWLALVVGGIYLCFRLSPKERIRIITISGLAIITLIGSYQIPAINESLAPRFQSLTDGRNDDSAGERLAIMGAVVDGLERNPFGLGLGVEDEASGARANVSDAEHDSTVINLLLSLGLWGAVIYASGIFIICIQVFRLRQSASSTTVLTICACIAALFAESCVDNVVTGPNAFLVWTLLGFSLVLQHSSKGNVISRSVRSYTLVESTK